MGSFTEGKAGSEGENLPGWHFVGTVSFAERAVSFISEVVIVASRFHQRPFWLPSVV
jgi:hypothetical protein